MKKSLKVFILVLMLGLLCVVVGCSGGEAGSTKIIITGETTGVVGEELTLSARISPQSNETITWASSDESTATVAEGVVSLLKEGNVTITASAADVKGEVTITIKAAPVKATSVNITGTNTATVGQTVQLTATVTPDTATNKAVTWKSENNGIAVVDDSGKVTTKAAGVVKITAEADGAKGEFTLTVTSTTKLTVASSTDSTTVTVNGTLQLTATFDPNNVEAGKKVVWRSSDESLATVDQNGLVTGVAAGKVTVTVTLGSVSASIDLDVEVVPVDTITITGETTVEVTGTIQLTATVAPTNSTAKTVTWSSSSDETATVDQNGLVTGVTPGDVTITAKCGGKEATHQVTVAAPADPTENPIRTVVIPYYNYTHKNDGGASQLASKTFTGSRGNMYWTRICIDYDEGIKQYVVTQVIKTGATPSDFTSHDFTIVSHEANTVPGQHAAIGEIKVGEIVIFPDNIYDIEASTEANVEVKFFNRDILEYLPDAPLPPVPPVCSIGDDEFGTLEEALAAAKENDVIEIYDGFVLEDPITIPATAKNVTLKPAEEATVTVKSKITLADGLSGLTIQGLNFTGLGQIESTGVVENFSFIGNTVKNIIIDGGNYATNGTAVDLPGFIHFYSATGNTLKNVTIKDNYFNIVLCYVFAYRGQAANTTTLIENNQFLNLYMGAIRQEGGYNAGTLTIQNNVFENGKNMGYNSILFRQMGAAVGETHNINILLNKFVNIGRDDYSAPSGHGGSAAIVSCSFQEAKTSVLNIVVKWNEFVGCTNGVYLRDNGGTADLWVSNTSYNIFKDIEGYMFCGEAPANKGGRNALDHNAFVDAAGTQLTDEVLATKVKNVKANSDKMTEADVRAAIEEAKSPAE